jgi:hypothetical protein
MAAAMFTVSFFFAMFAASGPLRLSQAIKIALTVAIPTALLVYWASFRFEEVDNFLGTAHPFMALAALTMVPLPFPMTLVQGRSGRDYDPLFMHARTAYGDDVCVDNAFVWYAICGFGFSPRWLDGKHSPEELRELLVVWPEGARFPDGALEKFQNRVQWIEACKTVTKTGSSGCVAIVADLLRSMPGDEVVIAQMIVDDDVYTSGWTSKSGWGWRTPKALSGIDISPEVFESLAKGDFAIAPAQINAITVGDEQIVISP